MCEEIEELEQCPQCHRQRRVGWRAPRACDEVHERYGRRWRQNIGKCGDISCDRLSSRLGGSALGAFKRNEIGGGGVGRLGSFVYAGLYGHLVPGSGHVGTQRI